MHVVARVADEGDALTVARQVIRRADVVRPVQEAGRIVAVVQKGRPAARVVHALQVGARRAEVANQAWVGALAQRRTIGGDVMGDELAEQRPAGGTVCGVADEEAGARVEHAAGAAEGVDQVLGAVEWLQVWKDAAVLAGVRRGGPAPAGWSQAVIAGSSVVAGASPVQRRAASRICGQGTVRGASTRP